MLRRGSKGVGYLPHKGMREDEETTRLPPGYRLDLIGDPCLIALVRKDGAVVTRFTHHVDPEEVRWAAEEDRLLWGKGDHE